MPTQAPLGEVSSQYVFEKLWLAAKVIESTMEGIFITNTKGVIEVLNPAFTQLTGYEWPEAIEQRPFLLTCPDQKPTIDKQFWQQVVSSGNWQGEVWLRHKDGHTYQSHMTVNALSPDDGVPSQYVFLFNDISEHKHVEQQLKDMSELDALTQLPNRTFLLERLTQDIQKCKETNTLLGLILLDLDRFKIINDTLGHEAGDGVLQQVSKRLRECLSAKHTIARIGGDEFAVIANPRTVEEAASLAEQIITCFSSPYFFQDQELYITPSLGIGLYPTDGRDSQTLLKHAEVALYRAKNQGRNTYKFFTSTFNAKALERLVMENRLRHALEREEFSIYYQPQVRADSGVIWGAEALIRWDNPDIGLIPPSEFIPLALETGLLAMIDNWVLNTACQQASKWQKAGTPIHISVNLSSPQLNQVEFPQIVAMALKTNHLNPELLKLEMVENVLMENPELTINTLREIKQLGVGIAIDDFGTGYSSLNHLKRLPISALKIDQVFVRDCIKNVDDAAIITAIVSMSHSLNLDVIAEGVETKEQLQFLYALHCDLIQGYIFSPAVPADVFSSLLKQNIQNSKLKR